MSRRWAAAAIAARAIRPALLAATIATLASASAAWAYSPDAVKAAEQVLQFMISHYQSGPMVEMARYNVLDMKYKAKAIGEDEFCKSAKPQLEPLVARMTVSDEQADEKKEWAAAIAAMDADRAKCRQASATFETLLFNGTAYRSSAPSLEQAQADVKFMESARELGLTDDIDIGQAKYRVVLAELRADKIDHAAYCASGLPIVQGTFALVKSHMDADNAPALEVLGATRLLYAVRAECNGGSRP